MNDVRECQDISTEYGRFECSEGGCIITDTSVIDNGGINFCPDCGLPVAKW